jgi:hypothetical protein
MSSLADGDEEDFRGAAVVLLGGVIEDVGIVSVAGTLEIVAGTDVSVSSIGPAKASTHAAHRTMSADAEIRNFFIDNWSI